MPLITTSYNKYVYKCICQNIRVKLNYCISHEYAVSNGVKQSGVMSPLLFTLYIQDLIECLDRKGLGCHMSNHFLDVLFMQMI